MTRSLLLRRRNVLPLAVLFMFLFGYLDSAAQQIKVQGGFLSDSLKVGEETAFYLSAKYSSDLVVLFPDSSFSFTPFEYQKRNYFATETENGISADSTVYYLTTFELDTLQPLMLPVYVLTAGDCTTYYSPVDTIRLVHTVSEVPDSVSVQNLPLKTNTLYHTVKMHFNTLLALIIGTVLLIVLIVLWVVFGKRIIRYLQARRMGRRHREFVARYDKVLAQLQKAFSAKQTESALILWKQYMEDLESRPYTKWTTRETVDIEKDQRLTEALRDVDKAIYGNGMAAGASLAELRRFADNRFGRKLEEVKHGK